MLVQFYPFYSVNEARGRQRGILRTISMACSVHNSILYWSHVKGYLQLQSTPRTADLFPLPRISLLSIPTSISFVYLVNSHISLKAQFKYHFLSVNFPGDPGRRSCYFLGTPHKFVQTLPLALLVLF